VMSAASASGSVTSSVADSVGGWCWFHLHACMQAGKQASKKAKYTMQVIPCHVHIHIQIHIRPPNGAEVSITLSHLNLWPCCLNQQAKP